MKLYGFKVSRDALAKAIEEAQRTSWDSHLLEWVTIDMVDGEIGRMSHENDGFCPDSIWNGEKKIIFSAYHSEPTLDMMLGWFAPWESAEHEELFVQDTLGADTLLAIQKCKEEEGDERKIWEIAKEDYESEMDLSWSYEEFVDDQMREFSVDDAIDGIIETECLDYSRKEITLYGLVSSLQSNTDLMDKPIRSYGTSSNEFVIYFLDGTELYVSRYTKYDEEPKCRIRKKNIQ